MAQIGGIKLHASILGQVCRVGGTKFSSLSQTTRYNTTDYKEELKTTFGIDISNDDPEVHPQYSCILCQCSLVRSRGKATYCGGGCGTSQNWTLHKRSICLFCLVQKTKPRGRPAKRKKESNNSGQSTGHGMTGQTCTDNITTHRQESQPTSNANVSGLNVCESAVLKLAMPSYKAVLKLAMPSYKADVTLDTERFIDSNAAVTCHICKLAVDRPVEASCCGDVFCCHYICKWLATNTTCSECTRTLKSSLLRELSPHFVKVIGSSSIHCDFYQPALRGCPTVVPLEKLQAHIQDCKFNPKHASQKTPIRVVNMRSSVAEVLSASPSKLRGDISERLTGHLVTAKADSGRLEVKTGCQGQPVVF